MRHTAPSSFLLLRFFLLFLLHSVFSTPASLPFSECTSGNAIDPDHKINVSTVYGQIVSNSQLGRHLNLTVIGNTGQQIIASSNATSDSQPLLSTLFTSSSILSFSIWQNRTFFCSSLVPPSPLPTEDPNNFYCPVSVGPVAFSAAIPLREHQFDLLTITTRLRVVDTSSPANELTCVDVATTPLDANNRRAGSIYGWAVVIFWASVSLTIAYWCLVGLARIVAAWGRGGTGSNRTIWSRFEGAGYILASAISGERFNANPALLRFCTPSMRDIIFHTQFCAALGMVAVQWPVFTYPLFSQTSWSTLIYNITLAQGPDAGTKHWNPLSVQNYSPPSEFADQMSDPTSVIFVDSTAPNALLMFPENTSAGIASFAASVGVRPQDLFGICLVLFLAIIAATITISLIIWGIDRLGVLVFGDREKSGNFGSRSPVYMAPLKDGDKNGPGSTEEDASSPAGHLLFRTTSIPLQNVLGRSWWRYRIRPNSFHGSILHGNLVRILILFHLPVTIFSCYQFTNAGSQSSLASVVLASLAFVLFSISLPMVLIIRLYTTATNKLYDETRTLMMLGPLYNHYGHGSQLFACMFFAINLVYGIAIGCGQKSGTAQAIIILVTEVCASLGTSMWLPWGRGASMGLISFLFCVARIAVAVLLVILTPAVSVGDAASGWVAAGVLFILGLMYLGFLLILIIKVVEALIRIIARIPFDRSKHTFDSGLFGVLGVLGCCGPRKHKSRSRRPRVADHRVASTPSSQQIITAKSSTPRSSVAGPPSVLRPEQALRPYREDSDDETGFIMGSWQPFPQPEYGRLEDQAPSPVVEAPPKTGFARVGGGRAHHDSPYAIQGGSTASTPKQEFPSFERIVQQHQQSSPSSSIPRVVETPSNRSTVTVNHQVPSGLPPGAMSPSRPTAHVRTKSQSAIIEDASALFKNLQAGSSAVFQSPQGERPQDDEVLVPPNQILSFETDDSSSDAEPKRSHWYNFRKNRRMSGGDIPNVQPSTNENSGRSFVVIRDKRPSIPQSTEPPKLNVNAAGESGSGPSFVVLRGQDDGSSQPRSSARRPSQP